MMIVLLFNDINHFFLDNKGNILAAGNLIPFDEINRKTRVFTLSNITSYNIHQKNIKNLQ